ncbi:MAG: cytochrome c oxidase cbb3-type subunit 4 [Hydrogenophaga sp.]|jgi:cytochrome c oxidase cbb3-type subunit 4
MDINDMRSIVTVLSLVTFIGIIVWAWSKKNQAGFDEAARLPFGDESIDNVQRETS